MEEEHAEPRDYCCVCGVMSHPDDLALNGMCASCFFDSLLGCVKDMPTEELPDVDWKAEGF